PDALDATALPNEVDEGPFICCGHPDPLPVQEPAADNGSHDVPVDTTSLVDCSDAVNPTASPSRRLAHVEERRVDLARRWSGRLGAEAAVLDQNDDDDLRPARRRPRGIPGEIAPAWGLCGSRIARG